MDLHPGENVIYKGHPSWRSILAFYIKGLLITIAVGVVAYLLDGVGLSVGFVVLVLAIVLLSGFIQRVATVYTITDRRLNIKRGIVARKVQETRLQRVQNVNYTQGVFERLLQVGNVDFDTAGTDDSDFTFYGVASPEQIVQHVEHATPIVTGLQGETETPS
jgi:uncharacterized membrane protein YdbT with pleckstrin-like domain